MPQNAISLYAADAEQWRSLDAKMTAPAAIVDKRTHFRNTNSRAPAVSCRDLFAHRRVAHLSKVSRERSEQNQAQGIPNARSAQSRALPSSSLGLPARGCSRVYGSVARAVSSMLAVVVLVVRPCRKRTPVQEQAAPNPSLNRTRYGSRRKPGVRRCRRRRTPGLRRLP